MGRYPDVMYSLRSHCGFLMLEMEEVDQDLLLALHAHLIPLGNLARVIQETFVQKQWTLALAESCTGGRLAAYLTAASGASRYFLGSYVVYAEALKTRALGVHAETIQRYGAASREVVSEMWRGLFAHTSCDYALSVTGVAGPTGATPHAPVGTIWVAMGPRGGHPDVHTLHIAKDRRTVLRRATPLILAALWRKVAHHVPLMVQWEA